MQITLDPESDRVLKQVALFAAEHLGEPFGGSPLRRSLALYLRLAEEAGLRARKLPVPQTPKGRPPGRWSEHSIVEEIPSVLFPAIRVLCAVYGGSPQSAIKHAISRVLVKGGDNAVLDALMEFGRAAQKLGAVYTPHREGVTDPMPE